MKYSQIIGVLAVLALAVTAFLPWAHISDGNTVIDVTGLHAEGTNYGKPALLGLILGTVCVSFFLTPKIWAKRTNVFVSVVVFAWAIKNYIIISACFAGNCPEKQAGLYLQAFFSFVVMIMALLPKIELPKEKE